MTQIQRGRILAAMAQAVYEQGIADVTVAGVVQRAGVSRRTFYELFADCEDCLLATLDEALARACARALPAYQGAAGGWRGQVRAATIELLAFFDEQPHMARLLIVEWLAAGRRALERRRRAIELIAVAVDGGRAALPGGGTDPPELVAEAIVGAVLSVLHDRLTGPRADDPLMDLANGLMSLTVLPYLGAEAAREELEQAVPDIARNGAGDHVGEDPLKSLNMRLTYRTTRVLAAVADHPAGSNRVIGEVAGIDDQGQTSKLLRRLAKLGLLQNTGAGAKGEPNAWSLTAIGERLERMLRVNPGGHSRRLR